MSLLSNRFTLPTVLLATVLTAWPTSAWTTRPPISFGAEAETKNMVQTVRAVATDVAFRRAQDAAQDASGEPGPTRFATPVDVHYTPLTVGSPQILDDGSRLWRVRIESPGALSLNLTLGTFEPADGAGLWIYSPDRAQVQGPYEAEHANGQGELYTSIILGSELVVELHEPADVVGQSKVVISRVNHGYRHFGELSKREPCNVDVVCPEGDPFRDQIRSVALYTLNGFFVCSGALVNNTQQDGRPLFLTAAHCSTTFPNLVVYWNFQMPTCGATSGSSLADNQAGAGLLFHDGDTDAALLELDELPPSAFNVYYAGWDVSGSTPESTVTIHHPSSDEKSISLDHDAPTAIDLLGLGDETIWEISSWEVGTTEAGSSGAPLFDQTTKLIKGTSFGGLDSCETENVEWFNRVSKQFEAGLGPLFDPGNTMVASLEGMDASSIFSDDFESGDTTAWSMTSP